MKKSLLITTALISLILPYSVMAEDLIVNGNQVIDDDERFYYGKIVVNQGGELTITDSDIKTTSKTVASDDIIVRGKLNLDGSVLEAGNDMGGSANNSNILFNGGTIVATDSDIEANGNITIDGANVSLSSTDIDEESYGIWADNNLTIKNNATISAIASYLMAGNNVEVTGGTINLQGGGTILGTDFSCDDHGWCKAGTLNMSGGRLVVQNGSAKENGDIYSNYVQAQNLNMIGGTLEIKNGAYLETISQVKDDASEKESGFINLSENATIDLSGTLYGTIQAGEIFNTDGAGTVNVNSLNAIIDGDFDGANLNIFANTTLSQLITGDIYSFGNLNLKNGTFILDKLPEDEDSGVKSFSMENGTKFRGIGLQSEGEVNINGGTFETGDGLFVSNASGAYGDDAANLNIKGGNITVSNAIYNEITSQSRPDWGGEINVVGNTNLNISGANTVINMNFTDSIEDNAHDGGILHEGKNGNINISGGTINLTGRVAKIERGGYDGDWIYTKTGEKVMNNDDFEEITGKYIESDALTNEEFQYAIGRTDLTLDDVDRTSYHISTGNINISGGTINLKEGARISTTAQNIGDINITGGKITGTLTDKNIMSNNNGDWLPTGRILHLGSGDLNIKGNAEIEIEAGDIQKGFHNDESDRTQGNVNISQNAKITLSADSHINSDQNVNISGGTITLYNNGSIDAYGDVNITGGNISISTADIEATSLDDEDAEDTWSAISSHYRNGNVYISGGNVTLYNNGAIGRSAHIDEGMDVEQFGSEIIGNIEISGGTINANGNSVILLGGGDGDGTSGQTLVSRIADGTIAEKGDIIIKGNADVTLNDEAEILHKAQGDIKILGGKVTMTDSSEIRKENIGSIVVSGGELNLFDQSGIYIENQDENESVDFIIKNNGVVTIDGTWSNNNPTSIHFPTAGIWGGELQILTGGTLNLSGDADVASTTIVDGGSLNISGDAGIGGGNGMASFWLKSGTVNITNPADTKDRAEIATGNIINLNNDVYGDINLDGGTVNLRNAHIASYSHADINYSGGILTAVQDETYGRITGLNHTGVIGDINIFGGNLTFSGKNSQNDNKFAGISNTGNYQQYSSTIDTYGRIGLWPMTSLGWLTQEEVNAINAAAKNGGDAEKIADAYDMAVATGDINISGGEITLNSGAKIEMGQMTEGNINITGGTITLNDSSIEHNNLLGAKNEGNGWTVGDSHDILISGANTKVILNGASQIITGGREEDYDILNQTAFVKDNIMHTAHMTNNPGTPRTIDEDDGTQGALYNLNTDPLTSIIIKDGATVDMNGTSSLALRSASGGNIQIKNGAVVNVKGTNQMIDEVALNNATININSGAALTVLEYDDDDDDNSLISGEIATSNNAVINVSGNLNADVEDNGTSTLNLIGKDVTLNGDATNLNLIALDEATITLEDQTLSANNITLAGTTLDMNGGVVLQALTGNISLSDESLISVKEGANTITAAQNINLTDSDIEIKPDATLTLNVGNNGWLNLDNGNIYVEGTLLGNVEAKTLVLSEGGIIAGGRFETTEWTGKSGYVSSFITNGLIDTGNLNITNSNITLDKANRLIVTDNKRQYAYEVEGREIGMTDENDLDDDDYEDEDITIKDYENQIKGTLTVDNSTLTLKSNLAADKFVVTNHSTLNTVDQIIGGKSLTVDDHSTANLTRNQIWPTSGFSKGVTVNNHSVLNVTSMDIGSNWLNNDSVKVTYNSTLNVTGDGFGTAQLLIDNSTFKVKNADIWTKLNDGTPTAVYDHATVDLDGAFVYTHGITGINDSNITLKNKSALTGNETMITNTTITANNSHVGAFKHAIDIDVEDEAIYNNINHGLFLNPQTDLTVSGSTITLNGTSELGASMAISQWDETTSLIGHLTREMIENPELLRTLNSKYARYEMVHYKNYDEDENKTFDLENYQAAADYQATVNIANSNITLNGTSKIINAMLNTEGDSGEVNFTNNSRVEVKGTNILSAAGDVNFVDSELVVNNKATLNVQSLTGLTREELAEAITNGETTKDLYLTNSRLNLAGVINGNIIIDDWRLGDKSTVSLNGGHVVGNVNGLKELNMSNQSGNTSKTLAGTTFTDLEDVVISGANAKVTLDSSVFEVSENGRYYWYDNIEKEYKDEQDNNRPPLTIMTPYNNQILGDFDVKNGATLTVTKHLSAENINVNGATFISNNALLAGNLNLSNKATATINGAQLGGLYVDNIDVQDNSTLNLNSIEYMNVNNLTANNSVLNTLKWTEMMVDELNLTNSKVNVASGGAWIGANEMAMNGGTMDVISAEVNLYDAEINNAKMTVSKNTSLGLIDASFNHSTLTLLDTSRIEAAGGSGDIIFDNNSALVIKGKSNINTYGHLELNDSTLDIASGAVLTTQTANDVINVNNLRLKLAGTLDATISGTIDTLILGTKASYREGAFDGLAINSFGVSGVTAAKDITRLIGGIDSMTTFEVTDKSNFVWDDMVETSFDNLNVENSTLSIKGDKGMWMGDVTASGSTVKILAGTLFIANEMDLTNTALTITGTALKKGETEYADLISTMNGINVDNSGNTKAAVAISNIALSTDVNISNVAKVTLTNVLAYENLNIFGTATTTAKGNVYNTVATLNNVKGEEIGNLTINDAKATIQKNSVFKNVNVKNKGYVEFKENVATDLILSDTATATLAAKKILTGDVNLNDSSIFTVQGIVNGDVSGGNGVLALANAAAKVNGDVNGVGLAFNSVKNTMSNFFSSDVDNVTATSLNNSTVTADSYNDFGHLSMLKSTLELTKNIEAASLSADNSTLKLGTKTLHITGDALLKKSTINISVDKNKNYGQLFVDGTLNLSRDDKGNLTTNLAVTLDKSLVNTKFHIGETFDFLNYGEVTGNLNKVTIANNRVTFEETGVGQFEVTEVLSGRGVIERLPIYYPNSINVASAIVDSMTEFSSAKQDRLANNLNALSQVVGGEQAYIQALEATNPDDNNMVNENTITTIDTVLSAVAERTSSSGISSATEGMASGDTPNGASVWTKVLYNKAKLDSTSVYAGFKSKSNGLALGVDKLISKDIKLGIGYAYTDGDIKNNTRKSDVDTHTAILYGEYKPSNWFVNGSISYGWSDYSNKAFSALGTTKSDFDVYATAIQLNSGYDINVTNTTILTPVIGMRYINVAQDSYKDSDDKYIAKSHSDIVTALASAKLKKSFELSNSTIIAPEARLGVSYDIVNDGANSVVRLSNGSSYIVEGRALKRFGIEAGAGVTAELNDNWELSAGYEGHFRKDYHDHTGMLNLKYNF